MGGRTDDDRPVYVRYRGGALGVWVGPVGGDIDDTYDLRRQVFHADDGSMLGGDMTYARLVRLTKHWFAWPKRES